MTVETITSGDLGDALATVVAQFAAWESAPLQSALAAGYLDAIRRQAAEPRSITLAWPSGVPEDARATLRAQIASELTEAASAALLAQAAVLAQTGAQVLKTARTLAPSLRPIRNSGRL